MKDRSPEIRPEVHTPDVDEPIRVLVLDDEEALRDIVKQTLMRHGCDVTTASEGGEGLQALLSNRFDVIVSDLKMEPMDGITFLSEALRIRPWIGVVVFSGFVEDDVRDRARQLGIETILEKPVSFTELAEAVIKEGTLKRKMILEGDQATLHRIQYELNILREVSNVAIEAGSLPEALRALSRNIGQILPSVAAGILTYEKDENEPLLVISTSRPVSDGFIHEMEDKIKERFSILSNRQIDTELNLEIQGPGRTPEGLKTPDGMFSVPIIFGNRISGILSLAPPEDYEYTDSDMSILYHAANHLTTVLLAFQRIREIAVRDNLTGLHNRHHLRESIETTWYIADRYGYASGILIFDIDHFKTINDNYGHPVGDAVLKEMAEITRSLCRKSDIISRYGGDEIVIVLPETDYPSITRLADRVLEAVREHEFCADTVNLHCTVSIGGALNRSESHRLIPPDEVFSNADHALYIAKRNGRDRCSIWRKNEHESTDGIAKDTADDDFIIHTTDKPFVAVIDDDTAVINIMKLLLEMEGCDAEGFSSAEDVRKFVSANPGKLDVAFVDLNLDTESGLDLIHEFHTTDPAMVMIVITGDATLDNAIKSMRHGAYDFVQKPIQREQLKMTLARALEYRQLRIENREYQLHLEEMVRSKSRDLRNALQRTRDSFAFTLRALTSLLDTREQATGKHSQRVQDIAELIAKKVGVAGKDLEVLQQGALLHDIGKIGIPDNILLKPGPLTDEEWKIMRTHPQIGYDIIKTSPDLAEAAEIVGNHHERWDGSGYPRGLKGIEIPLGARIFALADSYDAMRSDRPYRKGMSVEESLIEINKSSGTQFDPELVEVFNELVNEIEEVGKWGRNT